MLKLADEKKLEELRKEITKEIKLTCIFLAIGFIGVIVLNII